MIWDSGGGSGMCDNERWRLSWALSFLCPVVHLTGITLYKLGLKYFLGDAFMCHLLIACFCAQQLRSVVWISKWFTQSVCINVKKKVKSVVTFTFSGCMMCKPDIISVDLLWASVKGFNIYHLGTLYRTVIFNVVTFLKVQCVAPPSS